MRLLRAIKVHWYPSSPDKETLPRFTPLGLWANLSFVNQAVEVSLSQNVSEHIYGKNPGDSCLEKNVVTNSSIALEDARAWGGLFPHEIPLPGSWAKASGSPLPASSYIPPTEPAEFIVFNLLLDNKADVCTGSHFD